MQAGPGSSEGPAVEANGLTKNYGRSRGITDVNLQIRRGEVLGLLGANGAGKTTFMRTLLDFIRPTSGSLSVFGMDSKQQSVEVRRRCTYLPGELVLPPRMTGHEVIRRFTFARGKLPAKRFSDLAERLSLDLTRRVGDLSRGNKQKVGLVLAFAPAADLIVLDEPTSGLDPLLQREFGAIVVESLDQGSTVLLSSHVMREVETVAHRVALLREGRLVVVDEVGALEARSRRRGVLRPTNADDLARIAQRLAEVPGVSGAEVDDQVVRFASEGRMDALVKAVADFDVESFDVTHADLEDAFFQIYDRPGDSGGGQ